MFLERKDLNHELRVEQASAGKSRRTTSCVAWAMEGCIETLGHPEKHVYKESRKSKCSMIKKPVAWGLKTGREASAFSRACMTRVVLCAKYNVQLIKYL